MNQDWDVEINGEVREMWAHWSSRISHIQSISIPRRVICNDWTRIEIHGFCDASEVAYGACLYMRSITPNEEYTVRLLCAKSRIAPLKKLLLPRLELCGAVLLALLTKKVFLTQKGVGCSNK